MGQPRAALAMRDEDPDSDVLALVAHHDMTGALRCLMQRHGRAVYRYCREALRDSTLADDVHQQVFLAAFHDLPRFRGRSTVRTWLFGIARHRVLDAAKSRRRAQARIAKDDPRGAIDPGTPAGERIDDLRLGEALMACLNELAPHVRSAVLLRFQQGFTFEEMAEICDVRAGTLQAQVMRAMPVLRRCIELRNGGAL